MMNSRVVYCACMLVLTFFVNRDLFAQKQEISIIPVPVQVEQGNKAFTINSKTSIRTQGAEATAIGDMLAAYLQAPTGYPMPVKAQSGRNTRNSIALVVDPTYQVSHGEDAYRLQVDGKSIKITASSGPGLFYGVQTLMQLLPPTIEGTQPVTNSAWTVPGVDITDYARFGWRGLMLDVSRHFFSKDFLKRYIDQMVRYKFNVFHIHLTDDQGWRIALDRYPELTEKGAWRVPRQGKWWSFQPPQPGEAATYGGYYTKEDMREIIQYATERFVTIVPEINSPGHSLAAITAYPELACVEDDYHVNPGSRFYGQVCNALCAGNEKTFEFLDGVFTEIAELFPSEYIHVGGDEAFRGYWQECPKCQKRMEEHGLKNVEELQSYFIKRLEKILHDKGKRLIGWDEILEGGLAPDATVMSWRGMAGGIEAAKMGHQVIMTPNRHAYLDLYQGDPLIEPETYSMLRLTQVYDFEPVPEGIDPKLILGGQGNLWAESVPTEKHAEYMTWPRGLAVAEALWSPKDRRDWNGFVERVEHHFAYFEEADVHYARSMYDAIIMGVKNEQDSILVELTTEIEGLDIHYTFDETDPGTYSPKYNGQLLEVPSGASQIKVRTFRNGKPIGRQINCPVKELEGRIGSMI